VGGKRFGASQSGLLDASLWIRRACLENATLRQHYTPAWLGKRSPACTQVITRSDWIAGVCLSTAFGNRIFPILPAIPEVVEKFLSLQ
jgi:hypothetical protein